MPTADLLINVAPGETRVAIVEQDRLREITLIRGEQKSVVGNIYLGRVERVLPGVQAAFVDVGLPRSGFLALPDARPSGGRVGGERDRITDYASEGDTVLVQVLSDATADKGVKLTARLTLAGRYLVLTPGQADIRLSRRIAMAPRERLEGLLERLAEEGEGFIVRTAAAGAADDRLAVDVAELRGAWAGVMERRKDSDPPACLYRDVDTISRFLRDGAGFYLARVIVDDGKAMVGIRDYCVGAALDLANHLVRHDGPESLFEHYGVEEQIDATLTPVVGLASGGSIIIEETAALTAIDVNTGGGGGNPAETALRTNLEAAEEIARQARLRNLGGLLAVDFVSMRRHDHGNEVLEALRGAVAGDPCPTFVGNFTRLGLVEMTRRRQRQPLASVLAGDCPACAGTGRIKSPLTVALEALRGVVRTARAEPGRDVTVRAAPAVIEALEGLAAAACADVEERLGRALRLTGDGSLAADAFEVSTDGAGGIDGQA
jgi:ribonuclease G